MNAARSESPSPDEVETVLREVLRMLDLTRDIDRNKDDAAWSASGRKIHYLFDENVFEHFIRPRRMRELTSTFHAASWLTSEADEPRDWGAIAAQSALIASEYLFSGQLPGQRDSMVYMTEWHMWELRQRMDAMLAEFQKRVSAPGVRRPRRTPFKDEPFLSEDLRRLRDQGGRWTPQAIDRFVVARRTAHALAEDAVFAPVEQLRRIVSPPLRDRVVPVEDLLQVPPTDYGRIGASARNWMERLKLELEKPGHRRSGRRAHASLANDARALAFVQWAAGRYVGEDERVVFVTGDNVTFDAYRRWHAALDPGTPEFFEPFALRRLVQYAPIFNMNDGLGDITDSRELFELTRQAVEVALLPFNLARLGADGARLDIINRNREGFALKLVDHVSLRTDPSVNFFRVKLTRTWLNESRSSLARLTKLWQRTERAAIGSMYDSIEPRLAGRRAVAAADRADPGAENLGPALSLYVNSLLDQIVVDSIQLWAPLASRFIDSSIDDALQVPGPRARPPMLLRLDVKGRKLPGGLGDLVGRIAHGAPLVRSLLRSTRELRKQPEMMFALAAILALALGAWNQAERFADLARRASRTEERALRRGANDLAEFDYLHAVALRFRIAEIAPARSEGAQVLIERLRKEALDMLGLCLEEHDRPARGGPDQPLRKMRALAERAALNLFYFGDCTLTSHQSLRRRFDNSEEAASALTNAEADLVSCLEIESRTSRETFDAERGEFLTRVCRHFLSNAAACAVVTKIFLRESPHPILMTPTFAERIADLLGEYGDSLPSIVRLELYAYLHITGERPIRSMAELKQAVVSPAMSRSLPLDIELFEAIWDWLSQSLPPTS